MRKCVANLTSMSVAVITVALLSGCGRRPQSEEPKPAAAAALLKTLPDTAFSVEWMLDQVPRSFKVGETIAVKVGFRNRSSSPWPDPKTAKVQPIGAYAVRLSYRWWDASGTSLATDYEARVDLEKPVLPGDSAELTIDVRAPRRPGNYQLQLDLVQEMATWFEPKGAARALVPVKVGS